MEPFCEKASPKTKTTEFVGYVSGDYECFCLSKIPFEEWVEVRRERSKKEEYPYPDPLLMYPGEFFPEVCNNGKWAIKITVEVEKVE